MFDNLTQDALVGNFGGINLYIDYAAGDGNDLALYTAIPEVGLPMFALLASVATGLAPRRRRSVPPRVTLSTKSCPLP